MGPWKQTTLEPQKLWLSDRLSVCLSVDGSCHRDNVTAVQDAATEFQAASKSGCGPTHTAEGVGADVIPL